MNKTQLQFGCRKPSAKRGSLARRLSALAMSLLLICSLPLAAFAGEYDLAQGSVSIEAKADGQYVTHGSNDAVVDNTPVITQSNNETPTTNTVTINADAGATANVTLKDVNIDTRSTDKAAVEITGNGDVVIELDGSNTVQSGFGYAGVEKNTIAPTGTDPGSGNGNLTITDENKTAGSLEATGGDTGAGIGGGYGGNASNITISGGKVEATSFNGAGIGGGIGGSGSNITISGGKVEATSGDFGAGIGGGGWGDASNITISGGKVEATSGDFGAGIGGGIGGSGSNITITGSAEVNAQGSYGGAGIGGGGIGGSGSNITITGSAEVTAKSVRFGAGIGGGQSGSGSDITITGNAEVTAKGGLSGSGIGGGTLNTGSDITISGDAQVKAQGGEQSRDSSSYFGVGAAIGDGGKKSNSSQADIDGEEKAPNTDKLTPNGMIEYYAPGADMEKDTSIKTVTGTYVPPQPENPVQPAALYRVIGQDGMAVGGKTEQKDGVLTIEVDADFASLTGYLGGLQGLRAQGVETIVFVTNGATSTFALADLLASMTAGDSYTLTHNGSTVTFTLATGTDISGILK